MVSGQLKPYVGSSADVIGIISGSVISEVIGGKVGPLGEGK